MVDPVAEKSGFLKMYMSNHPDTLVAYAKWFGKVKEPITGAEMSGIDTKSMTLTCTLKSGGTKVVRVAIEPPLRGYEDVKPRLLEMKAVAQEKLGMIKAPRLKGFRMPLDGWISLLCVGTVMFSAFAPRDDPSWIYELPRYAHATLGTTTMHNVGYVLTGLHFLESLYTVSLCRKHTGLVTSGIYWFSTLLVGFPIWKDLRRRIQKARIDSVMKVE